MTEYTFRLGMLSQPCTLRLTDESLQVIDQNGSITRTIDLEQVRTIQVYDGIRTTDLESEPYRSEFCRITFRRDKSLYFRNGFYQKPYGKVGEVATNQSAAYEAFVAQLKNQIAIKSPMAYEVSGWLVASLAWWCNCLLGIGLLVMGIAGFWTDELLTALGLATFFLPMGAMTLYVGAVHGIGYWPRSRLLKKEVQLPRNS